MPAGLGAGLGAWLLAGGASAGLSRLDAAETKLLALRPPAALHTAAGVSAAELLATPLFPLTTGPGAIREPSIRLDGLSLTHRRQAALVSIDGKASVWLQPGESADGVTLQGITGSGATFDTLVGSKTLNLGQQSAESGPDPHAAPAAVAVAEPAPATGVRGPPEPASAPPRRR